MKSATMSQAVMGIALAFLSVALLVDKPGALPEDRPTGVDSRIQRLEDTVQALLQSSQRVQSPAEQGAAGHSDMTDRVASIEHMLDLLQSRVAELAVPEQAPEAFASDAQDQQLFEELVAKAGLVAAGATPQAFAPDAPDTSTVGASLVDTFAASGLGQYSQLASAHCEAQTCTVELFFPDAQAAVQNELLMMSWLTSVDPACGMSFDAVNPGDQHSVTRRIEIECG